MSTDLPVEKRFRILVEITRASHFAWRQAVVDYCPEVDPQEVVNRMWDITGVETADSYLQRIDAGGDVARQVAESIVWSSRCMGEEATLEEGERAGEYLVRHDACPWHRWHDKQRLLAEDRPGCDAWFAAMVRTINQRLGITLRFETLSALPDGDSYCLRRMWLEQE